MQSVNAVQLPIGEDNDGDATAQTPLKVLVAGYVVERMLVTSVELSV